MNSNKASRALRLMRVACAGDVLVSAPDATVDRPILGLVCGAERSLMVDAGVSQAHALSFLRACAAKLGLAVDWGPDLTALTHWHWDHSFGLSAISAPCYAHEACAARLSGLQGLSWSDGALRERVARGLEIQFCADMIAREYGERRDISVRVPELSFANTVTIELGGEKVDLIHIESDHSDDCVVALARRARVAFLGDICGAAYYEKPVAYRAGRVLRLFERLWALGADIFIEGHAEPRDRAAFFYEYADLIAAARALYGGESDRRALIAIGLDAKPEAELAELHRSVAFLLSGEVEARRNRR